MFIGISACRQEKNIDWDNAVIDPAIPGNPVYQKLNLQKEILAVYEHDTSLRRSSDVTYTIDSGKVHSLRSSRHFNCRAYFFNPNILTINIGLSSGIRGEGFIINYNDGKFYTEPYAFNDPASGQNKKRDFQIISQTFQLNKSHYSIGDSLYGKIDFYLIENTNGTQTEHCANGYFRARIGRQE